MSPPDRAQGAAADRSLGWLIALGACIVMLDQTVFVLDQLDAWRPTWNVGVFLVMIAFVLLAVSGLVLPPRVLRVGWVAVPVLFATVQATWVLGYAGDDLAHVIPWSWTLEPPAITLLVLVLRPVPAIVVSLLISSTPVLSGLALTGTLLPAVLIETPHQVDNVLYVVIFLGLRYQLRHLHSVEREAEAQREREARAEAAAAEHARVARIVHDEVLAVLSTAMLTEGRPPPALRRAALRALDVIESPEFDRTASSETVDLADAAAALMVNLREIDDGFELDLHHQEGRLRRDVAESIAAASAEALRNSCNHAGAGARRRVEVALSSQRVRVRIVDDGVGFDVSVLDSRLGVRESIQQRMRDIGGSGTITSQPGRGTEVLLSWPT